jgi:hypothetical protein
MKKLLYFLLSYWWFKIWVLLLVIYWSEFYFLWFIVRFRFLGLIRGLPPVIGFSPSESIFLRWLSLSRAGAGKWPRQRPASPRFTVPRSKSSHVVATEDFACTQESSISVLVLSWLLDIPTLLFIPWQGEPKASVLFSDSIFVATGQSRSTCLLHPDSLPLGVSATAGPVSRVTSSIGRQAGLPLGIFFPAPDDSFLISMHGPLPIWDQLVEHACQQFHQDFRFSF